jgi:hypothetical protein
MGGLLKTVIICTVLVLLAGCSSLSEQRRVTSEGLAMKSDSARSVSVSKPVRIVATDDRADKTTGQEATTGQKVTGYAAAGAGLGLAGVLLYAATSDMRPEHNEALSKVFGDAFAKIVPIADVSDNRLEISVKTVKLGFTLGVWSGLVEYQAKGYAKDQLVCEQFCSGEGSKWNTWGYASGEKALNEAFTKAIDQFDFAKCGF